ncbi:MAG TPA: 50S ribosomal protein L25 [Thermoguttaceae bacterium]|nr:50S ribosomal protein L25 [Thermoguttaceae bacterium]HPP53519.1 50S ribosomal protein L25 [Thermoguttaceae bacterium]
MAEEVTVEIRTDQGKRRIRRLRKAGKTPAVLYGHGQASVSLAVPTEQLEAVIRHGSRVVKLRGALQEQAIIRELQWDIYGLEILHVDFVRVYEHEMVEIKVPLELRGEAPGVKEGGVLEQLVHEVRIQCDVNVIPEKVYVSVHGLGLNGSVSLAAVELPPKAKLLDDPETVVVQCIAPKEMEEEEAIPAAASGEPELIGRKPEQEEEKEEEE